MNKRKFRIYATLKGRKGGFLFWGERGVATTTSYKRNFSKPIVLICIHYSWDIIVMQTFELWLSHVIRSRNDNIKYYLSLSFLFHDFQCCQFIFFSNPEMRAYTSPTSVDCPKKKVEFFLFFLFFLFLFFITNIMLLRWRNYLMYTGCILKIA